MLEILAVNTAEGIKFAGYGAPLAVYVSGVGNNTAWQVQALTPAGWVNASEDVTRGVVVQGPGAFVLPAAAGVHHRVVLNAAAAASQGFVAPIAGGEVVIQPLRVGAAVADQDVGDDPVELDLRAKVSHDYSLAWDVSTADDSIATARFLSPGILEITGVADGDVDLTVTVSGKYGLDLELTISVTVDVA